MKEVILNIGITNGGELNDQELNIDEVCFYGEEIGSSIQSEFPGRYMIEKLYLTPDGRYRVYRERKSRWIDEISTAELSAELTEEELIKSNYWTPGSSTLIHLPLYRIFL